MIDDAADELRRLDAALGTFEGNQSAQPAGVQLMRASLERQREVLLDELTDQELKLLLTRPARRGTGGELKLVAAVLGSLQDSLSSIAQSLRGRPTARGVIPGAVVESVELRVVAAAPGSLKLSLTPAFPETQSPLFEDREESTLDLSVGRLVTVLRSASADPPELLGALAELGPRATAHLQSLSKTLADGDATMAVEWRSPRTTEAVTLDSRIAAHLRGVIESVEEQERSAVYTGRLVGGSLVRTNFELELDDESVLRGPAEPAVLPMLEELFGQPCTATVVTRELRLRTGETKETHRLVELAP